MRTYGISLMAALLVVTLAGVSSGAMMVEGPRPADRAFDRCDRNGDGVIDRQEFAEVLRFLVRQRADGFRRGGQGPRFDGPRQMPPPGLGRFNRGDPRGCPPGPRPEAMDRGPGGPGVRMGPALRERSGQMRGAFDRPRPRMPREFRGQGGRIPGAFGRKMERPFGFERRGQMGRRGPMMPQEPDRPPAGDRPGRPPFAQRGPMPEGQDDNFNPAPPAPPMGPGEAEWPRERVIAKARQLMQQFDEDGDEQIAYEEFGGDMKRFQAFDRDGDGRVTLRELVRGLQREAPGRPGRPPAEAGPRGERGPTLDTDADRPAPPQRHGPQGRGPGEV